MRRLRRFDRFDPYYLFGPKGPWCLCRRFVQLNHENLENRLSLWDRLSLENQFGRFGQFVQFVQLGLENRFVLYFLRGRFGRFGRFVLLDPFGLRGL